MSAFAFFVASGTISTAVILAFSSLFAICAVKSPTPEYSSIISPSKSAKNEQTLSYIASRTSSLTCKKLSGETTASYAPRFCFCSLPHTSFALSPKMTLVFFVFSLIKIATEPKSCSSFLASTSSFGTREPLTTRVTVSVSSFLATTWRRRPLPMVSSYTDIFSPFAQSDTS